MGLAHFAHAYHLPAGFRSAFLHRTTASRISIRATVAWQALTEVLCVVIGHHSEAKPLQLPR